MWEKVKIILSETKGKLFTIYQLLWKLSFQIHQIDFWNCLNNALLTFKYLEIYLNYQISNESQLIFQPFSLNQNYP